jgi:hypothetical protein
MQPRAPAHPRQAWEDGEWFRDALAYADKHAKKPACGMPQTAASAAHT